MKRPPRHDTAHAHESVAGVPERARDIRFGVLGVLEDTQTAAHPERYPVMTCPTATVPETAARRQTSERHDDPGHGAARRELARVIMERLETLPETQRQVLALYYFEDLRLREIAEAFGVTESRICQIHAQAILAIKNALRKRELEAL